MLLLPSNIMWCPQPLLSIAKLAAAPNPYLIMTERDSAAAVRWPTGIDDHAPRIIIPATLGYKRSGNGHKQASGDDRSTRGRH